MPRLGNSLDEVRNCLWAFSVFVLIWLFLNHQDHETLKQNNIDLRELTKDLTRRLEKVENLLILQQKIFNQKNDQPKDQGRFATNLARKLQSRYFPYECKAKEESLDCGYVELNNSPAINLLDCRAQKDGSQMKYVSQTKIDLDTESASIRFYPISPSEIEEEIDSALGGTSFVINRLDFGYYVEGHFERVPGMPGRANCSAKVFFSPNSDQHKSFPRNMISYLEHPAKLDELVDESLRKGYLLSVRDLHCSSDGQVVRDSDYLVIEQNEVQKLKDKKPSLLDNLVGYMIFKASENLRVTDQLDLGDEEHRARDEL